MTYTECLAIAPMRCNSLITTIAYDVNEHAANLYVGNSVMIKSAQGGSTVVLLRLHLKD